MVLQHFPWDNVMEAQWRIGEANTALVASLHSQVPSDSYGWVSARLLSFESGNKLLKLSVRDLITTRALIGFELLQVGVREYDACLDRHLHMRRSGIE